MKSPYSATQEEDERLFLSREELQREEKSGSVSL